MRTDLKKVGVLGGTFDPIHKGHIEIAKLSRDLLDLDLVLLVVANDPYQKSSQQTVSNAWSRYRIAKASVANEPKVEVSPIEILRNGKSYTYDTLIELKSKYEFAEIYLIIGSDILETLKTWERIDQLSRLATLVVFERQPYSITTKPDLFEKQIYFRSNDLTKIPHISSSELKKLITSGSDTSEFLNKQTIRAMEVEKLYYKTNEDFEN